MAIGNNVLLNLLGFATLIFIVLSFGNFRLNLKRSGASFVKINGTQLVLDGKPLYVNGWNSYWLMDQAVEEFSRHRVTLMFQAGAKMGLTVCRTWAFNDGAYNALQVSLGQYDQRVFKALDIVIAEAQRYGIRLMLSLVNNLQAFGGKTQYVKWAWEEGIGLSSSNDSFFYDPSIRNYFKIYLKTMLTRKNTITGIEYRNDPTIFAWELINEPRCMSDPSGDTFHHWLEEMAGYVKSIDKNHLITVGHEGFYGPASPGKLSLNPGEWASKVGSDFIRNSKLSTIDFASIHIYPDQWLVGHKLKDKLNYISKWANSHLEDGDNELMKPVMITEFGLSNTNKDFDPSQRDVIYKVIFDIIHKSAQENKAGSGSFIWQFLVDGMEEYNDDFGIVPWHRPSTYKLLVKQSCRLASIRYSNDRPMFLSLEACQRDISL